MGLVPTTLLLKEEHLEGEGSRGGMQILAFYLMCISNFSCIWSCEYFIIGMTLKENSNP